MSHTAPHQRSACGRPDCHRTHYSMAEARACYAPPLAAAVAGNALGEDLDPVDEWPCACGAHSWNSRLGAVYQDAEGTIHGRTTCKGHLVPPTPGPSVQEGAAGWRRYEAPLRLMALVHHGYSLTAQWHYIAFGESLTGEHWVLRDDGGVLRMVRKGAMQVYR